ESALQLVLTRARLILETPPGAMLSVPAPVERIQHLVPTEVSIAIDNGEATIVSGTVDAIDDFHREMKAHKFLCMKVDQNRALHSPVMDSILNTFSAHLEQMTLKPPQIPLISNVLGRKVCGSEVTEPRYWVSHLRERVRFAEGIAESVQIPNSIFIEVGPGRDLGALVKRHIPGSPGKRVFNLLRHPRQEASDMVYLLERLGRLWANGVQPDGDAFYSGQNRKRISLPTYPFERKCFQGHNTLPIVQNQSKEKANEKKDSSRWFSLPLWKQAPQLPTPAFQAHKDDGWLIFIDQKGLGEPLADALKQNGQQVTTVTPGNTFRQQAENRFTLNPSSKEDYGKLLGIIGNSRPLPRHVLHCWSIRREEDASDYRKNITETLENGFYSFLYLVQAIRKAYNGSEVEVIALTDNMQAVSGEAYLNPAQSPILGIVNSASQENPSMHCRNIDISLSHGGRQNEFLLERIIAESLSESASRLIALRDNLRWLPTYEALPPIDAAAENPRLRNGGVYLITGGMGGIGLAVAKYLAQQVNAKIILTGRSPFPPRQQWEQRLADSSQADDIVSKIHALKEIEAAGGEVLTATADAADEDAMLTALTLAEKTFGPLHGVFHAAGILSPDSFATVETLDKAACEIHFKSKIWGLNVLRKLFSSRKPDFFFLMSSLSSVLGGLGFTSYAAANIYMDSLLQQQNRQGSFPWIAVNWDNWLFINPTAGTGVPMGMEISMNAEEGTDALHRVLSGAADRRVVHSLTDLPAKISRWLTRQSQEDQRDTSGTIQNHTREYLSSPYQPPRNTVEKKVTSVWEEFFGFDKLGVYDDFFEVGGDSLKAISLVSLMNDRLNISLPITIFFEKLTIEKISQHISDLMEKGTEGPRLEAVEKKEYYPTTVAQQKLYMLSRMEGASIASNICRALIVEGPLDRHLLESALRKVIERHESLRTTFHALQADIIMKIHDTVDFHLQYAELEDVSTDGLEEILQAFSIPFDLEKAPLLRVKLVKYGEMKHMMALDFHHIIADDVSVRVLLKEFSALYNGEQPPRQELQYKDYVQWQQQFMESPTFEEMRSYWLERFSDPVPLLDIPTDFPRPQHQSFDGAWLHFKLEDDLTAKLRKLSEETGTTLYMILLAALNILFEKYTGQEDITIASPVMGRDYRALDNIIGLFINLLPMRNFPVKNKGFRQFLKEVKDNSLGAYENQGHPFGRLVESLQLQKDFSRNPLNDVELIMLNTDVSLLEIDDLRFTPFNQSVGISMVDIILEVTEVDERVSFKLMYCSKLFKKETMERWLNSFKEILDVVSEPENKDIPLKDISISTHLGEAQSVFLGDTDDFGF
ncbi:MAG: KR domain-containing protein, partial [bacterium]|nr:KR domain-containing protein [bacterium]